MLILLQLTFGNIAEHDSAHGGTISPLYGGSIQPRPKRDSVLFHQAQFALLRFARLKKLFAVQVINILIFFMDEPGNRLLDQRLSCHA